MTLWATSVVVTESVGDPRETLEDPSETLGDPNETLGDPGDTLEDLSGGHEAVGGPTVTLWRTLVTILEGLEDPQ